MSASHEWTDWHLTPNGWVAGTVKRDNGEIEIEVPNSRVLTFRYSEVHNGYGPLYELSQEMWRGSEGDAVDALLARFGQAPQHL